MKRLAILITHPIQYYVPVFRLLHERGKLQVRVFYSKLPEQTALDVDFGRVVEWDIPLLEGYDFCFPNKDSKRPAKALIRAIRSWQPDALLVFGWSPPGHLAAMRYFKGKIAVGFRGDSTLLDERPGPGRWLRSLFLTWVYHHVNLAFYVGEANKRYFLRHGLSEQQLYYAPHAIDNERFADGPAKDFEATAAEWRKELGIRPEDFTLLFAGKFEPKKAPELLLRVIQQINAEHEGTVHLIMVGSGVLDEDLRQQSKDEPNVYFLGFQNQSQMPVIYRLADAYCLPSRGPGETWGLAVNEALASGRTVIVSNRVGCAEDLVQNGINGFQFEHDNEADLRQCILKLKNMPQLRDRQSHRASIEPWNFLIQVQAFEMALND